MAPTMMNASASGGDGEKREERADGEGAEALPIASPGNDKLHVCMYVVSRLSPPAGAHNAAA